MKKREKDSVDSLLFSALNTRFVHLFFLVPLNAFGAGKFNFMRWFIQFSQFRVTAGMEWVFFITIPFKYLYEFRLHASSSLFHFKWINSTMSLDCEARRFFFLPFFCSLISLWSTTISVSAIWLDVYAMYVMASSACIHRRIPFNSISARSNAFLTHFAGSKSLIEPVSTMKQKSVCKRHFIQSIRINR